MNYHENVLTLAHRIQQVSELVKTGRRLCFTLRDGSVIRGNYGGIHLQPNDCGRHSCVAEVNTLPSGYGYSVDMTNVVEINLDS